MAYTPQLPPLLPQDVQHSDISAGSPSFEKAVRPVRAVRNSILHSGADAGDARPEKEPVLGMRLSQFQAHGAPIQILVPGLAETLWFVPGEAHVDALVGEGVRRGRIWTAAELRVVAGSPEAGRDEVLTLARVKAWFDGDLVTVLDPGPDPVASANPEQTLACHACRERRFWRSVHGAVVCAACHPPAAEDLVVEWICAPDAPGDQVAP